jgi:hypothetical protein
MFVASYKGTRGERELRERAPMSWVDSLPK